MMGESAADTAAPRWECLLPLKRSQWVLALSCILLYLTLSGPCSMKCPLFIYVDALQEFVEYDASLSFGHEDGCHEDVLFGDVRSTHHQDDSPSFSKSNKICANSNHFCFRSTLSCFNVVDQCKGTFSAEPDNMVSWTTTDASHPPNVMETNSSWMPGYAAFVLSNGKVLSCSLSSARQDTFSLGNKKDEQSDFSSCDQPLLPKIWKLRGRASELEEDLEQVGFDFLDGNSSPRVEISPPSLEWGTRELYVPSIAFLNIKNSYSDSALHLYEPFSTDPQFYAYNFVEMSLEPGETSSIALVFLPRLLGSSSAHLVLQTSLGGFVIHASGLAVDSPYGVGPLIDFDVSSDGHLRKNISLFNPFDGVLYVEEVSAWIAISSENTSHSAHVACKTDDSQSSASMNFNDVLDVKGNKMSLMGVKPKGNWEINPLDRETLVEISFPAHIQGSIFGAFCMRLKTFSKEIPDTIVLPIEVDVSSAIPQFSSGSISVFFEFLGPGDAQGPVSFTLSLLNGASHLLRVVDIIEDSKGMKLLHVRFMKGLILYPETTTRIASVTYAPLIDAEFSDHDIQVSLGCKLLLITNDSTSPQIEIPCKDFVNRCSRNQHGSTSGASGNSCVELGGECAKKPRNTRTESLGHIGQNLSQTKSKLLEVAEADELILRNWRSHKTMSGISVLEDREIQFPVVQVGTRHFKWITVNNPSEKPVLMQLILNSGTIIDQCKDSDEVSVPFKLMSIPLVKLYLGQSFSNHLINVSGEAHFDKEQPHRSLSEVQKTEVDFVSQYPDCSESRDRELEDKQVRDFAALDHQKDILVSSPTESMVVTDHTISESPPTNNLTVKIMKERVRRRKKRNAGVGKGFAGKFEVSSSQSGNSTPSSPLSPHTTCTPRRMCPLSPDTPEQPFTKASSDLSIDKEKAFLASMETILPEPETSKKCYDGNWLLAPTDQPSQPRKTISKPVLLPSATFPVTGWRAPDVGASAFLTSTSAIAPHARAPGSKLSKDDSVKSVERRGLEEEFTYDIWGNHFSEFNLLGNTNEGSPGRSVISPRLSDSWEGDSQSFFARGPLVLM
ncbi:hypothetical protein QJS10_CPB19g01678 [Acorus calamus]|uniref:Transmembrane protein 131-like N-terminal domain-containing protein n=1 Tax=Acorus calamus TaxID=4465 RepID=A0AAV9CJ76_ACOCL|nr:hypothetical protein QJS10_CPB19g01678 [Acorus calamus]